MAGIAENLYIIAVKGGDRRMELQFHRFALPDGYQRENLCYSDGMGVEKSPTFLVDREFFDNYVLMYVKEGALLHRQQGETYRLLPGEYVFADLKVPHRYWFEPGERGCILWTHLNGWPVTRLAERIHSQHPLPVRGFWPELEGALLECFALSGESRAQQTALSVKLYEILLTVLSQAWEKRTPPGEESQRRFRERALEAVSRGIYQPLDLGRLAKELHLSKYHFCRAFQQAVGQPAMRYLMGEKLRAAQYHLLYTGGAGGGDGGCWGFLPAHFPGF